MAERKGNFESPLWRRFASGIWLQFIWRLLESLLAAKYSIYNQAQSILPYWESYSPYNMIGATHNIMLLKDKSLSPKFYTFFRPNPPRPQSRFLNTPEEVQNHRRSINTNRLIPMRILIAILRRRRPAMIHISNIVPSHHIRAVARIQRLLHRRIAVQLRNSRLVVRGASVALAPGGEPVGDGG
jgi:hypothetical protein